MKKLYIIIPIVLLILFNFSVEAQSDKDYKKFKKHIRKDNISKVLSLISSGKNINSQDEYGTTPLLYSLQLDKSDFARIFIEANADINITDNDNNGCLHYAIENCSDNDMFYQLVDMGADINLLNVESYSPYHYSILYDCFELPAFLIDKGANFEQVTSSRETPIHLAVMAGCQPVFDFLLEKDQPIDIADAFGSTPFLLAMEYDRRSLAEELLELGADVTIENNAHYTPVYYSIENNNTSIFDELIKSGAKTNVAVEGFPPLYLAAAQENEYFVSQLLQNGAENPMNCDLQETCFYSAYICSINAELVLGEDKLKMYQESYNYYNLAKADYKAELNSIRAKNAAKGCLSAFSILFGGVYFTDYEVERTNYLKKRISICEERMNTLMEFIGS